MKTTCDSLSRRIIRFRSGFSLLLLLFVLGGCQGEPKVAKVDLANGAVKGTLKHVPVGTVVVLCRIQETSCVPLRELTDAISRRGEFAISMVPPGHYVIAYALPDDTSQGKPKIAEGETLAFTFGSNIHIEATLKDGKWRLGKDTSSDTHLIAAGAELGFVGLGEINVSNCSVKHKASGLWMEFRDGHRYESVDIEPNKVVDLTISRWAGG